MPPLQPHKDICAIKVPFDACNFTIENECGSSFLVYKIHKDLPDKSCKSLPEGNWHILGEVTKDHISFDVEPFVKAHTTSFVLGYDGSKTTYWDHAAGLVGNLNSNGLENKNDSFYSLLAANGLDMFEKLLIIKKV